jgi:hypothetical protein
MREVLENTIRMEVTAASRRHESAVRFLELIGSRVWAKAKQGSLLRN